MFCSLTRRSVISASLLLGLSACKDKIDTHYREDIYSQQKAEIFAEQADPQHTTQLLDQYIQQSTPDHLKQYTYRELIQMAQRAEAKREAERKAKIEAQRKKEAEKKRQAQRFREIPQTPLKQLTSGDYTLLALDHATAKQVRNKVLTTIQQQAPRFKSFSWQDLQHCAQTQGNHFSWSKCLNSWQSPAEKAAQARAKEDERLRAQGLKWNMRTANDGMSGKDYPIATVQSLNTVNFDFPYQGEQRATLRVRRHPRYGLDVLFSIEKGQFHCRVRDCPLVLRFDAGGIQHNDAGRPEDYSSDLVFLENPSQILAQLKRSRSLKIQATFYNEGNRLFEFNTEGLTF